MNWESLIQNKRVRLPLHVRATSIESLLHERLERQRLPSHCREEHLGVDVLTLLSQRNDVVVKLLVQLILVVCRVELLWVNLHDVLVYGWWQWVHHWLTLIRPHPKVSGWHNRSAKVARLLVGLKHTVLVHLNLAHTTDVLGYKLG